MNKVIDNDYHPDDKGLEASQEDHWGTMNAPMMSISEGTSGDRAKDAVNRRAKGDSERKDQSRFK